MKYYSAYFVIFLLWLVSNGCKTTEPTVVPIVYKDSLFVYSPGKLIISFKTGKSFNHPTFVLWEEDLDGTYQRTIFITQSYASGIFGFQMIGDSLWLNEPGSSYQPAALPYWTHKKGPIKGSQMVPSPENPFVDAYTGATPINNFQFQTGGKTRNIEYRILLEVNQSWDWNAYWSNNKFPNSPAYKHSAQPSMIYAADINQEESSFYLKPIGHGDPTGESGDLFTDWSTLTTAMEIFDSIRVEMIR